MKKIYCHVVAYKLLYLGLLMQALFYLSISKTGWLDIFFSGGALHNSAKGIDFYQVLRGAWAYWYGGSLTGQPLLDGAVYAPVPYYVNTNVYHPAFTIFVGTFLASFSPNTAYLLWFWLKLPILLAASAYFYWNFRQEKYVQFGVFILLANFSAYLELAAGQFQFVLNICLLLFLTSLAKKRHVIWTSTWYWISLFVKPIGLLFVPTLLAKRHTAIVLIALAIFTLETLYFWISGQGGYYITNLMNNIVYPTYPKVDQIITLNTLLRNSIDLPTIIYQALQDAVLALTIFLGTLKRIHPCKGVFLMIVYFLCFYNLVYEYDWSTLAYVLAVCVVALPEFQTRLARFWILLTCLPSCFIVLKIFHFDVTNTSPFGFVPGDDAWRLMIISKLFPLIELCISVLAADIKPIFQQMQEFFMAMRKTNAVLGVFGEEKSEMAEN